MDFPYHELHDSLVPALLERTEVFGVEEFQAPAEIAPYDRFWAVNDAWKPIGGHSQCFPGLDPILNDIVRNVIGLVLTTIRYPRHTIMLIQKI